MKILIVEDNDRLQKNIQKFLKMEGFTAECVSDGEIAFSKIILNEYDLVILDINLPNKNGLDICAEIRKKGNKTPVLMLTSRSELLDKIEGLNVGADDYLTKPFAFEELIARVNALIRRSRNEPKSMIEIQGILIDTIDHIVRKSDKTIIKLSPKEYAILEYLIHNRGKTKNRTQILDHVWGEDGEDLDFQSDTVEVHIAYLRKKLGQNIIATRRGYGYLIE